MDNYIFAWHNGIQGVATFDPCSSHFSLVVWDLHKDSRISNHRVLSTISRLICLPPKHGKAGKVSGDDVSSSAKRANSCVIYGAKEPPQKHLGIPLFEAWSLTRICRQRGKTCRQQTQAVFRRQVHMFASSPTRRTWTLGGSLHPHRSHPSPNPWCHGWSDAVCFGQVAVGRVESV